MKTSQLKKQNKAQKGFAMLEVMLAILIIAIASFGVYKLYSSSSSRTNLTKTESGIGELSAQVDRFASTRSVAPALADLVTAQYISADTLTADQTGLVTSYGPFTYTAGTAGYSSFVLTSGKTIPEKAIKDFVYDMVSSCDIILNDAKVAVTDPAGITPLAMNKVELYFPKGSFVATK